MSTIEESNPKKWDELIDDDIIRIHYLMKDILGWECFISWEEYNRTHGYKELLGQVITTPTHVAFCHPGLYGRNKNDYRKWRVFTPDHKNLEVFNPIHNLNDTWKLVEKITQPPTQPTGLQGPNVLFTHWWQYADVWAMSKDESAQAICEAAWNAWHGIILPI